MKTWGFSSYIHSGKLFAEAHRGSWMFDLGNDIIFRCAAFLLTSVHCWHTLHVIDQLHYEAPASYRKFNHLRFVQVLFVSLNFGYHASRA